MSTSQEARGTAAVGVSYAVLAYGAWGFIPILWKQLAAMPSLVVVSDRVVTSFVFVALVLTLQRRWPELLAAARDPRSRSAVLLSAALISANWLIFMWAVAHDHILDASLGYFINPLLNVFLAHVVLGEALRPLQWAGVGLAALGVLALTALAGEVPWIALSLAATFAAYGMVRRRAPVEALTGLMLETTFTLPLALAVLGWAALRGEAIFGSTPREQLVVAVAGAVTALPLWWFALAARRLRFSTVGLLQFISPTGKFALAVLIYDEPFGGAQATAFALIWAAIALYCVDALRSLRAAAS